MKTTRETINKMTRSAAAVLAVGACFACLPPVQADTLTFTNASAVSVAATMSRRYGVTIVFRGSVNTGQPVTFSVDDPDTVGGRLEAVSSLASALNMDFQKVYIVSKVDPGAAVPAVALDTNGPIVFSSLHVSARDAIETVASVDNAWIQISSMVDGDVVLPETHMSAADAAAVIAKQTGTEWKAYYGLFPRGDTAQLLDGQHITQLPLLTYRSSAPTLVPLHTGQEASLSLPTPFSTDPNVASVPNTNFGYGGDNSLAGYGYGDPYGYTNPYGAYGYATPNGGVAYPGAVYAPGSGVAPAVPGVNAPGVNAAAGPTGATILPGFPYMGSVGGAAVGGY